MKNWEKKLENKIKKYLKGYPACHDYFHLDRVRDNALLIAKEVECDHEILEAAALLHDVGYKGFEHDHRNHHVYGMNIAGKWLPKIGFPKNKIDDVIEAIRLHDNFHWDENGEITSHTAAMIIQDADRIDALGAIGIARIAYYHGEKGFPIYNDKKVPKTNKVWLNHSLLDQIKRDPMKKWQYLNFKISKRIAKKRADFVKKFHRELKQELEFHHKK